MKILLSTYFGMGLIGFFAAVSGQGVGEVSGPLPLAESDPVPQVVLVIPEDPPRAVQNSPDGADALGEDDASAKMGTGEDVRVVPLAPDGAPVLSPEPALTSGTSNTISWAGVSVASESPQSSKVKNHSATIPAAVLAASEPIPLEPTAETVLDEGFESGFPGTGWTLYGDDPMWDDTTYAAANGSRSAWCGATTLNPANGYADNMWAWMVFGPFSLENAISARMDFALNSDTESDYDYIGWYASIDGSDFSGSITDGDTGGWVSQSLDLTNVYSLGDLTGEPQVWIAFIFQSDGSISGADGYAGSFIDDVRIIRELGERPEYLAQCASDSGFGSIVAQSAWTENEQWSFSGLEPGETYWYRVKARHEGVESAWSNVESSRQQPIYGNIEGMVWEDADGDGSQDAGEDGLSGITVFLDADYDGSLDAGETEVETASDGSFTFTDVPSGLRQVAVVPPAEGTVTYPGAAGAEVSSLNAARALKPAPVPEVKTNATNAPIYPLGSSTPINPLDVEFNTVVGLDDFRADPRFAGIDGSGWAVAILDSGLDNDNDAFGPDSDSDGVADRIVYQYDFGDGDTDASAASSAHGTNVASVAAASRTDMLGVAPGADIINLKVFADSGSGNFGMTEGALQWVNANVDTYRIASINMSLGDSGNYQTEQQRYGVDDEMEAIAAQDCFVVSASGNSFFSPFDSEQGVAYPSADPNSLSIGATFDADVGGVSWTSGAEAFSSDVDRITPFSQRDDTLTTVFAPGAIAFGGGLDGGTSSMTGTSQASPLVAGVGVLAQQLADRELGRRLTQAEFISLLRSTAVTINDGDDEDDNVTNTRLDFPRVDMFALGEAILAMGRDPAPHTWLVRVEAGATVADVDFGIETAGETWDDWQEDHFTEAERADPSLTGPDADYDGDGVPNLIEFALGMDPTAGGDGQVHEHAMESGNHMSLTVRIDGDLTGITYEVRASDDLVNWMTIARSVDGGPMQPVSDRSTVSDPGGTVREVTVTDDGAVGDTGRFLRLQVTQP